MKSVLIFSLLLSACDIANKAKDSQQSYSYNLTVNGCSTGNHSFNSLNDYCEGLENESLNNGCAQEERGNLFSEKCPGTFSPARIQIQIQFRSGLIIRI